MTAGLPVLGRAIEGTTPAGQGPREPEGARRTGLRCLVAAALILWPCIAPAEELNLPEDQIKAGRLLYMKMCARCHGRDAAGGSAPDIQGMIEKDVMDSAKGVEAMPEFAFSGEEAGQIAVYLMSLAPDQARLRLGKK